MVQMIRIRPQLRRLDNGFEEASLFRFQRLTRWPPEIEDARMLKFITIAILMLMFDV